MNRVTDHELSTLEQLVQDVQPEKPLAALKGVAGNLHDRPKGDLR